jgi:hypothetical protein
MKVKPGEGRYDPEVEFVINMTQAEVAVVLVLGGNRGTGFALAARDPGQLRLVAATFREIADDLEQSLPPEGPLQ